MKILRVRFIGCNKRSEAFGLRRQEAYEQVDVGAVDLTPWPYAKPVGIGLIVFVLAIYAWFADLSAFT